MVELRKVPPKIVIEAYLSGSVDGPDSFGGLDGQGPMVVIDLEKREIVTLPGFQERLEAWRKTGRPNPCPLKRKPILAVLNSLVNHERGCFYAIDRREIVQSSIGTS